jgi:hypothetical protein
MALANHIYSEHIKNMASELSFRVRDSLSQMTPMHPECMASYDMQGAVRCLRETADQIERERLAMISNERKAA